MLGKNSTSIMSIKDFRFKISKLKPLLQNKKFKIDQRKVLKSLNRINLIVWNLKKEKVKNKDYLFYLVDI